MGVDGIDKAYIFDEYFDDDRPKITNFEKIKAMDIDEMAEFLSEVSIRPCNICNAPLCKDGYVCSEGWGWWLSRLESEVRE